MSIKNVVLVGATGNVGSEIYKALRASPANFNITILTRPGSQSKQPEGTKVIQHEYSDEALVDALRGQDAIVTAINNEGAMGQIALIDAAVKAGVKKFIPTEYGSDTLNPVVAGLHPWYAENKTVHDHLVATAASNPGFTYTALITGPFLSWGIQVGFLGYDLKTHVATIIDGGDLKVSYTEISQAALAVARALERDVSGYLHISSLTASQNEILEALERIGGESFERKEETTKKYHEMSEQMMQSGDMGTKMQGYMIRLLRIGYSAEAKGNWGTGDNAKLGLEETKLNDLVKVALGKQ